MSEVCIRHLGRSSNAADRGAMKVCVLQGGIGREREVSLQSGRCVAEALRATGLDVVTSDIHPGDLTALDDDSIDVFFIALHGEFGEDGQLQEILEGRGLAYTGSGPEASRLAFDKTASKRLFAQASVPTAPDVAFGPDGDVARLEALLGPLGERFVVKPVHQGSSVGVYIVSTVPEAVAAARRVADEFGDCMIESFVEGREMTVGVVGRQALPIIEIRSRSGFYDYHAKYVDEQTEYLFDTVEDAHVRQRVSESALACFDALGCRHFARVDLILAADGLPYVLEVNTIPGFTTHSLLPKAAARTGLYMSELCVRIAEQACATKGSRLK